MLFILTTKWHQATFAEWLEHHHTLNEKVKLISYEELSGKVNFGNYLFTDLERLSKNKKRLKQVIRFSENLKSAGCKVINDPKKALMRYDLQKALGNEFKTWKLTDDLTKLKFPVFIRLEHGHEAVSELLNSNSELQKALKGKENVLICEYTDTSDCNGLYHKYSAFLINGVVIPRHKIFSKYWIVKEPDVETQETLEEERVYCQTNPHELQIRDAFKVANIDYGRIDYSIKNGKMHVWEINSNPTLNPKSLGNNQLRNQLFKVSADSINMEFSNLSIIKAEPKPIYAPFSFKIFLKRVLRK